MKPGQIVYFRKCRLMSSRKAPEIEFEGNGCAILLGALPLFAREPDRRSIWAMMGTIGFISFDDLKEFLSEELMEQAIKKFEEKYSKPCEHIQPEAPKPSA